MNPLPRSAYFLNSSSSIFWLAETIEVFCYRFRIVVMKNGHYLFQHWSFLCYLTSLFLFLNIRRRLLVIWCCRIRVHLISSSISVSCHRKRVCCCFRKFLLAFLLWPPTVHYRSPWNKSSCLLDLFLRNFLIIKLLKLR